MHATGACKVNNIPQVSTQSDFQALIKAQNIPHPSYDIDGDGVVSQEDYALAKVRKHSARFQDCVVASTLPLTPPHLVCSPAEDQFKIHVTSGPAGHEKSPQKRFFPRHLAVVEVNYPRVATTTDRPPVLKHLFRCHRVYFQRFDTNGDGILDEAEKVVGRRIMTEVFLENHEHDIHLYGLGLSQKVRG